MKNVTHFFRALALCLVTLVCSGAWATVQTYQKVTSAPTDWSGEYLIVYEAGNCAMDGSLTKLDAVSNTQTVTISDDAISLDDAYSFTIASMDGGYSIQAKSGKYIGNASNSNALTASDNAMANTLSLSADGDVLIVSAGGAYLRYNATSGQTRFRYYKSSSYSSQKAIHLYKKGSVTPPPAKELVSIAVTGTPTKTSYYVGDAFDTDGLVVTGTYSDASKNEITKDITWTVTPETLALGTTSVSVKAKVGDIESTAYTVNGLSVTEKPVTPAGEYTIDFESALTTYTDWVFANAEQGTSTISAHGGTYYGTTGGKTTASIQTKNIIAGPKSITCYVSKQTTNTTASSWYIQTSTDGTNWTNVKEASASSMSKGVWVELSADLSSYSNVYVRIYYNGSTAYRNIDDITLTTGEPSTAPSISADNVNLAADATSGEIAYTINNPVTGKTLTATTEASWISNIQVAADKVTFTTTANTGTAERTADITLKYEDATDKVVTVTQAKPVPTYASLAELVAAGEPTTDGEPVNVTLTNEAITKFYTTGDYTNGVFLQVGAQEIEIYCKNVPETWEVGGTISGTLTNCLWKNYNGTWELCPDNWDNLGYTAPAAGTLYTITWSVNGTVTTEDVEEGDPINFKPATVPAGYTDYVFRGWTASETVSGSTEPTYVTTATATGNVTYYAVFARKTTTGGGSGDYELVAEDQSNWSGDYLIAYSNEVFADGRVGGTSGTGMGAQNVLVNPEDNLDGTTVSASWGDLYNITLEEVSKGSGTYLMLTKDGKYNYQSSNSNGLAVTENRGTAESHPISINFVGSDDVQMIVHEKCIFHYNTNGYFRFYKDGGQSKVYLYKKQTGTVTYSDFCTVLPTGLPVVIGPTGYATFYDEDNRIIPTGVKAYYCTEGEEGVLNTVQITNLSYIPTWAAVILEGTPGTYYFEETPINMADEEETDKIMLDNVLNGTLEDMSVEDLRAELGDYRVYVLSKKNDRLGFYEFVGNTLAGRKAFYINTNARVNGFILDFNGQTVGINSVISATNLKAGYDIQGRRINQMQKGINILDGKKIIK